MSKLTKIFLAQPLIAQYFETEEEILDAMMQPARNNARMIAFDGSFNRPFIAYETRVGTGKAFGPELYIPLSAKDKIREATINILEEQLAKLKESK